ncbi:hypothetical protein RBU49_12945 [Clostridium sp. MB40-C1]|uniref:hypothetical protein n=1 Tax=Clostridium sp. MB40-C1 TaxID=3070996 RepID=UPI0027E18001|nr:hypothetical protein [Clostridium sp. MB40-C1]WMJ79767.1 hypothetical protein RBU49_12945 [Clostridium sp. MB40-C1]
MRLGIYKSKIGIILFIILIISVPKNIIINILSLHSNKVQGYLLDILESMISVFIDVGAIYITYKCVNNEELIEKYQLLRDVFSKWKSIIWADVLTTIIIIGLTMFFIIPGIIGGIYYSLAIQVVILKGLSGGDAIHYSKEIVDEYWWNIFVIQALAVIMKVIVALPMGYISEHFICNITFYTILDLVRIFFTIVLTLVFFTLDFTKNKKESILEDNKCDIDI